MYTFISEELYLSQLNKPLSEKHLQKVLEVIGLYITLWKFELKNVGPIQKSTWPFEKMPLLYFDYAATNALFEWFRCKIKGATEKVKWYLWKMFAIKKFRPKISCFNIVKIQKCHFLKRPCRLLNCTHIFLLDKSYVSTDVSIGTC